MGAQETAHDPDRISDDVRERLLDRLDAIETTLTGPERSSNNPVNGRGMQLHLLGLLESEHTPTAERLRDFIAAIDVDGPAQTNAYGVCLLTRRHLDANARSFIVARTNR